MQIVNQSKLYCADGVHNGNCFAACLATILDLPLWMVPPFEDMFARDSWRLRVNEWLEKFFGLRMTRIDPPELFDASQFCIANGLSARGVHHSVVYREGTLVHDPHPSKSGIEKIDWFWILEKAC